jgi:hypothetical protein
MRLFLLVRSRLDRFNTVGSQAQRLYVETETLPDKLQLVNAKGERPRDPRGERQLRLR